MQTYRHAVNYYANPTRAYQLLCKLKLHNKKDNNNTAYAKFMHNSKIFNKLDQLIK